MLSALRNGNYMVATAKDLSVECTGWSTCETTLYLEGTDTQPVTVELDMEKEEIISEGCQQFLFIATKNRELLVQKAGGEVNVYDVKMRHIQ